MSNLDAMMGRRGSHVMRDIFLAKSSIAGTRLRWHCAQSTRAPCLPGGRGAMLARLPMGRLNG